MTASGISSFSIWIARLAWVVVMVFGGGALGGEPGGGRIVIVVAAIGWTLAALALAFRSTVTLTVMRTLVPVAVPAMVALIVWSNGRNDAIVAALAAGIATVAAFSGDVGAAYVQASAYGSERRSMLRPPVVYVALALLNWTVACAGAICAAALTIGTNWWAAGGMTLAAGGVSAWGWPRWHKLSRRWLVLVPAGLVIHDHVVLASTAMLQRRNVAGISLASRDSGALDLSGGSWGPRVEVRTVAAETITMAASPSSPAGRAIHATALVVVPSRPGRFLADAAAARVRVGAPLAV